MKEDQMKPRNSNGKRRLSSGDGVKRRIIDRLTGICSLEVSVGIYVANARRLLGSICVYTSTTWLGTSIAKGLEER